MARSRRTSRSSRTKAPSAGARARTVWLCLMGAMTAVGGSLLLLDRQHAPRVDGRTMPALAATGTTFNLESVLKTNRPLDKARWKAIVIHHSDSPVGSPESIAREHTKLGFKGIGHHFVVGNGRGMDDGDLHVTYRWMEQYPGAHAGGRNEKFFNNNAISICLVGDGAREHFTAAQLQRTAALVDKLCDELGIARDKVYLHRDIAPTADPGSLFPERQFRAMIAQGQ
ncbi:MAG TPA: peptidoglycan recognition family protein [Phycisphaerales bacterium]|nr:peptidoglycan recognition family protein [Phycisphaerales bacterium]